MEIVVEWDGFSGVIKVLITFLVIFFIGFWFGRKTRK
tara:strand:- start:164 stop:274 length:111 start_codon:yes stop_codon:yes gene_type:complete